MGAAEGVREECGDLQLLHAGGSYDGGGDLPLAPAPGQGELCGRQAVLLCHSGVLSHCLLRQGLGVALHIACAGTGDKLQDCSGKPWVSMCAINGVRGPPTAGLQVHANCLDAAIKANTLSPYCQSCLRALALGTMGR